MKTETQIRIDKGEISIDWEEWERTALNFIQITFHLFDRMGDFLGKDKFPKQSLPTKSKYFNCHNTKNFYCLTSFYPP